MKIEKIPTNILGDIRQRMGAKGEDDPSFDKEIEDLLPKELVEKWCGWHLGSEIWGAQIIDMYLDFNRIDKEK